MRLLNRYRKTMKAVITSLMLTAALLLFVSCNDQQYETDLDNSNTITMSVKTTTPVLGSDEDTKVTFSGENLVWESTDNIGILLGNNSSASGSPSTYSTQELSTKAGYPGVFTGTVSLGDFTTENILGVVYPYYEGSWVTYKNGLRLVMQVGTKTQVQNTNNVLNGANFPLFSEISYSDISESGGVYSIEDKAFNWGCSVIRFNIYGTKTGMASDEIFKTISLKGTSKAIVGTAEWKIADDAFVFNGSVNNYAKVSLTEECTIADKTSTDGIKVFMAVLPRGTMTFTEVKIETDKAVYTKSISQSMDISAGNVKRVALDMSNFDERVEFAPEYSTDGGTTWSSTAPVSTDVFTTLSVRGGALSLAALTAIKDAIAGQASAVDLDLSAIAYESTTFPTGVFTATKASPNTTLKSIKFPSNVKIIAEGEASVGAFTYCTALTSVDLTGFTKIGRDAFTYCGLTSVTVPNTVTAIGTQAFRWCYNLLTINYDSPASTGQLIFAYSDADATAYPEDGKTYGPTVVIIGSSVTSIPVSLLRSNCGVTSITITDSPVMGATAFKNCENLATVICLSKTPPTTSGAVAENAGVNVAAANRKVIVPVGSLAAYQAVAVWGGSDPAVLGEFPYSGFTLVEAE